ncbi:hypothetical protein FAEPRAA2165_00618 [Faecalibacterium duncaniae]|uniref:Uncharacterized protein n=1 Tax=Faecalibacterium duncaniae (strain DSM 17677 / JCM 31915 / A2-165) TaxID=411483 RepID=C7H2X0_FAED2|nr:hypothetical protein FAEPRAA2165_00618 [Faecalibacterium duncaniae]
MWFLLHFLRTIRRFSPRNNRSFFSLYCIFRKSMVYFSSGVE